jgi:membrane fusion protein, heavy metal efflux system
MHCHGSDSASGRKIALYRVQCSVLLSGFLLFAGCFIACPAVGHEGGHDDQLPVAAAPGLPRLVAKSEAYELVGILQGERFTIYLDRFDDNAPVTDASITVSIDGEPVPAEVAADGTYLVTSKLFDRQGSLDLVFDIRAPAMDDLLIGKLLLPPTLSTLGAGNTTSLFDRAWTALRHGAQDHLALLSVTVLTGFALGLALRRRRVRALPALMLGACALAITAMSRSSHAHEGGHPDDSVVTAPGDTARRLPNGQVFIPKPMQRILDIRTVVSTITTQPKSMVLVGRIMANPNRSGLVQSITGGRVIAPEPGLPRLGQRVAKGDVLASVEPAMPIADRTTISERIGEIEQLIAVTEAKLKRLRTLAERGVGLQSLVVEAELELEGLHRRREVVRETRIEPEVLRAPVDGVVAMARVVSGQVVQAQDVLFQIVDPQNLWVEAYDYGDNDPASFKHATAIGPARDAMTLDFQGWSRTLQQQATLVQFAIADPPTSVRVGQPVTVTVQRSETATGFIVSRDAVVRGGNGEAVVWCHIEPEQFEARPVRTEPFDATRVAIVAGVAAGERIVVRGAELINQIH